MPFAYPQLEKRKLVWSNCAEVPPLTWKDLSTKGKTYAPCISVIPAQITIRTEKFSGFTFQREEKKSNFLDLYLNKRVVFPVAGLNSFMLQRLFKPYGNQHPRLGAGWHEQHPASELQTIWGSCGTYYKLYILQWACIFTDRHSQVRRQQWEGRGLYANVRTQLQFGNEKY